MISQLNTDTRRREEWRSAQEYCHSSKLEGKEVLHSHSHNGGKKKTFTHFDNSFRQGIIVAASVRHFFSSYSYMNTHQLLSSCVLHKPRAMTRTAWTVDCNPWGKRRGGTLCHPLFIKKFNIKNLLANVFCTHTKDSSRHKKQ